MCDSMSNNLTNIVDNYLSKYNWTQFTCPICSRMLIPPIYFCLLGSHSICFKCLTCHSKSVHNNNNNNIRNNKIITNSKRDGKSKSSSCGCDMILDYSCDDWDDNDGNNGEYPYCQLCSSNRTKFIRNFSLEDLFRLSIHPCVSQFCNQLVIGKFYKSHVQLHNQEYVEDDATTSTISEPCSREGT